MDYRTIIVSVLALLGSAMPLQAAEIPMTEGAVFARCYNHLTGHRVPNAHPLLIDSIQQNNRTTTVANCMTLFDKARLLPVKYGAAATNYPTTSAINNEGDLEGIRVLNHFYSYYGLAFEERDNSNRPQTYSGFANEHWDYTEDVLFFLRATFEGEAADASGAFVNDVHVSSITEGLQSLSGYRVLPTKYVRVTGVCTGSGTQCGHTPTKLHGTVQVQDWRGLPDYDDRGGLGSTSGTGYLLGVKVWPPNADAHYGLDGTPYDANAMTGRNHMRTQGAGYLGTASHLLKNGQYSDRRSGGSGSYSWRSNQDGGIHNRRRLIKNAFSTSLCLDQPPLRLDDDVVLARVKNYQDQNFPPADRLSFRESQLCASCHVAYDEAAAVYRNTGITVGNNTWDLNGDGGGSPGSFTFVFSHNIDGMQTAPAPHLTHSWNSNNWYNTKPEGALHFRNFRGEYVTVNLPADMPGPDFQSRGIQELGAAMANTDQYYACLTKRIFHLFTGIDVSLEDHGDSRLDPLPARQVHYRDNFIVPLALGKDGQPGLQQHQSIRRLVQEILSLDLYGLASLRDHVK